MASYVFVPGLGTDARVFSNLISALGLSDSEYIVLEHAEPSTRKESMSDYVDRMCERVPQEPFHII